MAETPTLRALLCASLLVEALAAPAHATPPMEADSPVQIFVEICVAPDRRPQSIHEKLIARGAEVISNPRPGVRGYTVQAARFEYSVRVNGDLDCAMIFQGIDTDDLMPEFDRLLAASPAETSVVGAETVGVPPESTLIGARLVRQPEAPAITLAVYRIDDRIMLIRSERPHL